jgi:hypothetical protein
MDGDISPERKPIGMGRTSTLHVRTPHVRVSQVSTYTESLCQYTHEVIIPLNKMFL